jgi:hypothetical protein
MNRGLGVFLVIGFSACVAGGVDFTKPSAAFDLTGDYVLAVQTAERCELPVARFEWNVVGVRGTTAGGAVVMTLPGNDRRVHLVFCSTCQADPSEVLADLDTDGPPSGDAPVPGGLKLLADVTLTGKVESGASGRAEVRNGVAEGTLALSRETDEESDALGSCLSEFSSWSLTPR